MSTDVGHDRTGTGRRVAFMAYFFPPIGGGGTPRSAAFARYLPAFGYRPIVYTIDPGSALTGREFQRDESLEEEFDLGLVERRLIRDPQPIAWRKLLERLRVFPVYRAVFYRRWWELHRFWAMASARAIVADHARCPYDLIYASAGPYSTLEAAARAASRTGRPWVADLRDLWTRDSLRFYPSRPHYLIESRLERRVLGTAAAIVANTQGSAERLREWLPEQAARRVTVIPNGFGGDRKADAPAVGAVRRRGDEENVVIVYTGTLYDPGTASSRPGRYRPLDLDQEARSIRPLLRGLSELQRRDPATAERIRLRIFGYAPAGTTALVADYGLQGQVSIEGLQSRAVAAEAVRTADALLVQQVAFADQGHAVPYVPGKVYEYIAAGVPILAPVGPGDLADLLSQVPQAHVCDYRNPAAVADGLRSLAQERLGGSNVAADPDWLQSFHRRNLTGRLAAVFDGVLAQGI